MRRTCSTKRKLSSHWNIVRGEACLGEEALCASELQSYNTAAISVGRDAVTISAVATEQDEEGLVTAARSGLLTTAGALYGSVPGAVAVIWFLSALTRDACVCGDS